MADDEHNHDFSEASAGASLTYPLQCSALRKNQHVVIKGRPCKIVDMSTSKTGKHGHAKVHLVGIDIFTDKKMEELCPSTHNMDVPNIINNSYDVVGLTDDDFLYLMDKDGNQSEDIKMPEGKLGDIIKTNLPGVDKDEIVITAQVTQAMGETHVTKVETAAVRN